MTTVVTDEMRFVGAKIMARNITKADEAVAELVYLAMDEARGVVVAAPHIDFGASLQTDQVERDMLHGLPASVLSFIVAIKDKTPNGEWIAVQYHPNGDWSVAAEKAIEIDEGLRGLHDETVGPWLSAALDDPKVCVAMKADIEKWFEALSSGEGVGG